MYVQQKKLVIESRLFNYDFNSDFNSDFSSDRATAVTIPTMTISTVRR